jgi:hypothetical protein
VSWARGAQRAAAIAAALASAAIALGAGLLEAAPARADAQWQLEQPPPPAGARFKVPLGRVGDLEFYAPNAGLMSVEGNATEPRGLYFYDGRSWRLLSTVCTDTADTSRIAWAGPNEFWVVTQPSFPRIGSGLGLCHFKNGAVVPGGSYSTPINASDPFLAMDAAWCNGPNDCWFGGQAGSDPLGQREGSFQIHWDGTNLTTSYSPQGRGISDIQYFQGKWYETAFVGAQRENRTDPTFVSAGEPFGPELLRGLGPDGVWRGLNWLPDARDGVPDDGSEVLAMNASATDLWFAGGGAASGPDAPSDGSFPRPPFAVHQQGIFYQEVPLDTSQFSDTERFVDIAAVPGSTDAWAADQPFADRASAKAKAKVALLHANGTSQVFSLPSAGAGRGSAARIACPAANDCWMVTSAGWVFHYTDGTVFPQNTDPAFASVINDRPNEAAAQFVPDTPPPDDSTKQITVITPTKPKVKKIPPLIKSIRKPKVFAAPALHGYALVLTFYVTRPGKVQLLAYRHKKVVARTKLWKVHKGWATLRLLLFRNKWPTALAFILVEHGKKTVCAGCPGQRKTSGGGGGGNTVSTAHDLGASGAVDSGTR